MAKLTEKALLVKLSISQWSARKEDKKITKEVETNHNAKDAGRYHKHLLAKTALEKIQKNINAARTYHYDMTLPWTIDGQDILTTKVYFEYCRKIDDFKNTHAANVREFLDNYPQYIEEARARLNGLFNPADYPPIDKVKKLFSFTVQFFPIPGDIRTDLNQEEIDRLNAENLKRLKEDEQRTVKELWERLYKTVAHAAERLTDTKAIFRNSLIENLTGLCSLLPKLNFTDDPDLEKARRDVENKLLKFTPDTLREDEDARRQTAEDAREILKGIKTHLDTEEEPAPSPAPPACSAPIQTETETPAPAQEEEEPTPTPEETARREKESLENGRKVIEEIKHAQEEAKAKLDALQDALF